MATALRHRGPDGTGFLEWREGAALRAVDTPSGESGVSVGFAHTRLSILDLSERGDQPMVDSECGLAMVYNGELYNYIELRDELEARGHEFRSTGDTEVVLGAFREWGRGCVERFVGMWALAVLDTRERTLTLSRDRFGIKPLYWAWTSAGLVFASEIKALLAAGVSREPNDRVVRRYLLTGRVDESQETFFDQIRQLPPAHDAVVDATAPREPVLRRYWSPPPPPQDAKGTGVDAEGRFASLLRESIRVHVRSDVPIGTCLSGGLDSSAVVCVADALRRERALPHYTHHGLGYVPADEALSERRYMDSVVAATGIAMSYVTPTAEEVVQRIPDIVRQQDEPFGTASIAAQWFVFRRARSEALKVMLDGQGADEYLAGYHGFLRVRAEELLRRRRLLEAVGLCLGARRAVGASPVGLRAGLGLALAGTVPHRDWGGDPPAAVALLAPAMRRRVTSSDWLVEPPDTLEGSLRRHLTLIGLPGLLRFEDRNSMAHSIEARVPFLDHRLVEYVLALPTDAKLRGAETKSVLRRSLAGTLPEDVRTRRDKIGFRAEPAVTWLVAEQARDELMKVRSVYEEQWLDRAAVERMLRQRGGAEAESALWRLVNLKLWLRSVVEAEGP